LYASNSPLIFDCFEFYGQEAIKVKLLKNFGDAWREEFGMFELRMMELLAGQEMSMSKYSGPENTLRLYEKIIDLKTIKLRISGRYIRLENCLKTDMKLFSTSSPPRVISTGFTELHRVATSGCPALLKQLLFSLATKNLLMTALSIRSSPSSQSVLEAGVSVSNHRVVKVLLRRAVIWCFQGTRRNASTALHFAVRATAPRSSPYPEASISCWEDVADLVTCRPEKTKSLLYLLKSIQRYNDSIVGWDGSPTFQEIVDWRDENGMTALMWASKLGNAPAVKLLLQVYFSNR
jgi:hypothetical protein